MEMQVEFGVGPAELYRAIDVAAELVRDRARLAYAQEMRVGGIGRNKCEQTGGRVEKFGVVPKHDVLEGHLQRDHERKAGTPVDPQRRLSGARAHKVLRRRQHNVDVLGRDQVRLDMQSEIFHRRETKFYRDVLFGIAREITLEFCCEIGRIGKPRNVEAKRLDLELRIADNVADLEHAVGSSDAEGFPFRNLQRERFIDPGGLGRIPRGALGTLDKDVRTVKDDAVDDDIAVEQIVQADVDEGGGGL